MDMTPFIARFVKSSFFLFTLTAVVLVSTWDYPGYFTTWATVGLPLVTLTTWALYAVVYYILFPTWKKERLSWKETAFLVLTSIVFTTLYFLITRYSVSEEEFQASYNSMSLPYGLKQSESDIILNIWIGSLFTYLLFFGICCFLVSWHRKKNIRTRIKKWWRFQSLSDSGLHVFYIMLGWICWLFFTLSPTLISGKPIAWGTTLLMLVPSIMFFYINLKTSFNLLADNKIVPALMVTLCWWVILLIVKAIWFFVLTKGFGFPAILDGKNVFELPNSDVKNKTFEMGKALGTILKDSSFKELIILLASFIYGYDKRITKYRKELQVAEEARQQELLKQKVLEKEVVDARLQSLKYQINPHFLFNSLNFLYSQALPLSDDLANATMLLSKMMRYGLQENNEEAKVSLAGEVEHLQNFIAFNQLRFSNQLQIDFRCEGQVAIRRIMPLLLITFVENAFKYGELNDPENPLKIHLKVDAEQLSFFVWNKKRKGPKEDSTGIGLENIRRRLALGYPEKHSLKIADEVQFYSTELTVTL